MKLQYDEEILIDEGRQEGDSVTPWMVFSWARAEGDKPVRVQAHRSFVKDNWGVENLRDEDAVKAAYRAHRDEHLEAASHAPDTAGEFRVYTIR
jgi:hypothetical protein